MNVDLTSEFTAEEVERALKQMKPLIAPKLDGMSPIFFKSCSNFISKDVIAASLDILNSGSMIDNLNHTFISLIPKTKTPKTAKDFQPISLCNVLYKIISKTIANRLKKLLPKLVSETQSAFMSDRLISDNILIAFETLHHLKNKRKGKLGFMALKLNISKAYDKVEWVFMEKLMAKLGFADRWISLISSCIRFVSYSILVNGEPHDHFAPNRGLRQGNPLSPYLFLLCAEGLHSLIQRAEQVGSIKGVLICRDGPKVSHLFFAVDSLLFCHSTTQDYNSILEILQQYEAAFGQQINRDKIQLFFSPNTDYPTQESIKTLLGVSATSHYERYLGLPSFVGKGKKQSFSYIRERIWHKMQG